MTRCLFLLLLCITASSLQAQGQPLLTDMDGDSKADTVFLDTEASTIVCALSSQHFKRVTSKTVYFADMAGLQEAKNGFILSIQFNRANNNYQFRYDKEAAKMRLIDMTDEYYGNAVNDGSGEGSVNLLTNTSIGNWSYYDEKKDKLIKKPTEKEKTHYPKIYLDTFGDELLEKEVRKK